MQKRVAKNESTTDLESSDTGQKPNERAGKKNCHLMPSSAVNIASSDVKFLKLEYLVDLTLFTLIQLLIRHITSYIRGVNFQPITSMTSDHF